MSDWLRDILRRLRDTRDPMRPGDVQGNPVEEQFRPGEHKTIPVEDVVGESIIGVSVDMERTASVEALADSAGRLVIEASYDGGVTWQHLTSAEVRTGSLTRAGQRVPRSGAAVIGWGDKQPVPTHTRCRLEPAATFRSTVRVRPILLDTRLRPGGGR